MSQNSLFCIEQLKTSKGPEGTFSTPRKVFAFVGFPDKSLPERVKTGEDVEEAAGAVGLRLQQGA